ncbi:MAG: hypothetical protein Q9218_000086 [Villophora microphyllina]
MPSKISSERLGKAIVDSVQDGTYPDEEDIISAQFPPSAVPDALKLFDDARNQIQVPTSQCDPKGLQKLTTLLGSSKQLRNDIETAQRSSQDILAEAEQNNQLRQNVHDAGSKLRLLEREVAFNQDLATTLAQIRRIQHDIGHITDLLRHDELPKAIEILAGAETVLESVGSAGNIKAVSLLETEAKDLRQEIAHTLTKRWDDAIHINARTVSLSQDAPGKHDSPTERQSSVADPKPFKGFSVLANTLDRLGYLEERIANLTNVLEAAIIVPRLQLQPDGHEHLLVIEGGNMSFSETASLSNFHQLVEDFIALIQFVQAHLPPQIVAPLAKELGPRLVEALISTRLSYAVPEELSALGEFNQTRDEISLLAATMGSYKWPGANQLRAWSNTVPQVWLQKRQNSSLHKVRQLLKRGYGDIRTVERMETQIVSQQDNLFTGNSSNDNWNAGWSDEETSSPPEKQLEIQVTHALDNEEDGSAWGLDDEGDEEGKPKNVAISAKNDVEADAWGWGDDQDMGEEKQTPRPEATTPSNREVNGQAHLRRRTSERELTLKETYHVTSLPLGILELIDHVFSDIDALSEPSGNMFLYNDCLWLADQLRQIVRSRNKRQPDAAASKQNHFNFDDDITALEAFGKRSYGKEMESQRTIIKDLLDGAQGFGNCTEPPFSQECDLAISSIVDRLRDIHRQWRNMLSHSALMQSVGSLLSTIVDKIIIDIEDMSDISEPQSQRLTIYCQRITTLEDLFSPQEGESSGKESVPLTAVYTPGWFKFQYLSEILDSSLVDIKYLWTDGGLKLEYEAEEVVELIEALFADSEHRRRAIGEIRRASKV